MDAKDKKRTYLLVVFAYLAKMELIEAEDIWNSLKPESEDFFNRSTN